MAYDETLARRLRSVFRKSAGITEKRMFGGIAFMLNGNMCAGVAGKNLMLRVGPEKYPELLKQPHAMVMDFTGKVMTGYIYVEPAGLTSDRKLEEWLNHALDFVRSLPGK